MPRHVKCVVAFCIVLLLCFFHSPLLVAAENVDAVSEADNPSPLPTEFWETVLRHAPRTLLEQTCQAYVSLNGGDELELQRMELERQTSEVAALRESLEKERAAVQQQSEQLKKQQLSVIEDRQRVFQARAETATIAAANKKKQLELEAEAAALSDGASESVTSAPKDAATSLNVSQGGTATSEVNDDLLEDEEGEDDGVLIRNGRARRRRRQGRRLRQQDDDEVTAEPVTNDSFVDGETIVEEEYVEPEEEAKLLAVLREERDAKAAREREIKAVERIYEERLEAARQKRRALRAEAVNKSLEELDDEERKANESRRPLSAGRFSSATVVSKEEQSHIETRKKVASQRSWLEARCQSAAAQGRPQSAECQKYFTDLAAEKKADAASIEEADMTPLAREVKRAFAEKLASLKSYKKVILGQRGEGHRAEVQYCDACGYTADAIRLQSILKERLPYITVDIFPYARAGWAGAFIGKVCQHGVYHSLGLILLSCAVSHRVREKNVSRLSKAAHGVRSRKAIVLVLGVVLMLISSLFLVSGAFEVTVDDLPFYSRLSTPQMIPPEGLADMIASILRNKSAQR